MKIKLNNKYNIVLDLGLRFIKPSYHKAPWYKVWSFLGVRITYI